jgi:hypothetical protein
VALLPTLQISNGHLVVGVGRTLCPHVDPDRRPEEVAGLELVGERLPRREVARGAPMRAGELALAHVLQIETVFLDAGDGFELERRVAGIDAGRRRIVDMGQVDQPELVEPAGRRPFPAHTAPAC